MKPLLVDSEGNGLYETAHGRAFVDFTHPEDRWIADMAAHEEANCEEQERQDRLWRLTEEALGAPEPDNDPWDREIPSGSMEDVPA